MIIDPSFEHRLKIGQTGEDVISCWLRFRGWSVLPVYPIVEDDNKGPRLYTAHNSGHSELIATDMLAMKNRYIYWLEAKRKSHFAWWRQDKRWQTGIDLRHYQHYLHVREVTQMPVWLFFLHVSAIPSAYDLEQGCPSECPTGLFGGEIKYLDTVIAQQGSYTRNGRSYPMVYWQHKDLKTIATLKQVMDAVLNVGLKA